MLRFLCFLCCVSGVCVFVSSNPVVSPRKQAELMDYLFKYGYLKRADPRYIGSLMSMNDLEVAIKKLQRLRGLKENGRLDDQQTLKLLDVGRCGVPDFGPADVAKRKRRYNVHGTVWEKKDLTFRIKNYADSGLSNDEIDKTIEKSLEMWSKASQLKFKNVKDEQTKDEEVDILISFVRGYHDDSRPADGPGKELAHAFFPLDNKGLAGDLHFDNDEKFTLDNQGEGVDLLWITLHELGHSLGLDHSYQLDSVMFPFYLGYKANLTLDKDDIEGIQLMYGMPPVERVTPTPHTDPTVAAGVPDICDLRKKIDTIVTTKDEKTYVFSGSYFWEIEESGAGEPQRIKGVWDGLTDDIDAAFTRRETGETYFFKGSKYWIFKNLGYQKGPNDIDHLNLPSELTEGMDAALEWPGNGRTYFFKGTKYWRYDWYRGKMDEFYPRAISTAWLGVPDNLDAAQRWINGKTYFFKGEDYYALRKRGIPRVDRGYPKKTSIYWMGCSKEGLDAGGRISPKSKTDSVLPNILVVVFCTLLGKLF